MNIIFHSTMSRIPWFPKFVHDIISNLDGAVNRGHKQTDLIIMNFTRAFDKVPTQNELLWGGSSIIQLQVLRLD